MNLISFIFIINSGIIVVLSLSNTDNNNLNSKAAIPDPQSISYEIKTTDDDVDARELSNKLEGQGQPETKLISKTLTFDKTDEPDELKSTKIISGSHQGHHKNHRFIFPKYSKEFTNFYKTIFKNNNELQIGCEEGFTSSEQNQSGTTQTQQQNNKLQRKQRAITRQTPQYKEPNRFWMLSPIFFVVPAVSQNSRSPLQSRFLTPEQLTQECSVTPCYIYANPDLKNVHQWQPQHMFEEVSRNNLPAPKKVPSDPTEQSRNKYRDEIACLEGDITKCAGRKLQPKFRVPEDLDCPDNDITKCTGRKRKSTTPIPPALFRESKPSMGKKIQIEDLPCSEDDISKCKGRRKMHRGRGQQRNQIRLEDLPCNESDITKCEGRKLSKTTTPKKVEEYLDTVPPQDLSRDPIIDDYDILENCTEDDITKCMQKSSKICNEDNIEKCPGYSTTLKENLRELEKPSEVNPTKSDSNTFRFQVKPMDGGPKDKPTDCLWAVISCCTYNTDHLRKGCLHAMNCPQSKWGSHHPCSKEFAKISYDSTHLFYDN